MPRTLKYIIGTLFVLRVALSLWLSDGLFKSDSITYFGAVVNLGLNGSIASIQPADDEHFAGGARPDELYEHLASQRDPLYRPLSYQWLHTALYAPILFFWRSIIPVLVINNLLFFGAGLFFFRAAARDASVFARCIGWMIFAFFPPFFYLTSQFLSEPLFLFLLGGIILLADRLGWEQFYLLFIFACAASLTRPFGFVIVCALVLYTAFRGYGARAAGLAMAALLAFVINMIVMRNAVPEHARIFSVSAATTFYCTNTTEGNGDFDYYFNVPAAADRDTLLQSYRAGSVSGAALIAGAVTQNFRAPARFVKNGYYKLSNYFFSIVPASWIYPPMHDQPAEKKRIWLAMNLLFFAMVGAGLASAKKDPSLLFGYLFTVGLVFHFFLLARYRYDLPLLVYGAAFIPLAVDRVVSRVLKK